MLSHVDEKNQPTMVNIASKDISHRRATAESLVTVPKAVMEQLSGGDIQTKKGPVFATAIIAGTMAVKRCWELIPFCHPLPIDGCKIEIEVASESDIRIHCTVDTIHKTGVEMEALTGASIAALTVYDMCKAISQDMIISSTRLLSKTGGKSDVQRN